MPLTTMAAQAQAQPSRFRVFIKAAVDEPLLKHQERATEWLSSFFLLAWAGALQGKGDTFSLPGYREFARNGLEEHQVALFLAVVGTARIIALIINGAWPRSPMVRLVGASLGMTIWMTIAALLYQSSYVGLNIATPGPPVYGILAIFELLSCYRATLDVRYRHA